MLFRVRTYPNKIFRRFSGLFWPIFDPILGGNIDKSILPPKNGSKIGSKEPENRLKLFIGIGSILIGLIRLYQWTIGPLIGETCRFYPSCSQYAVEALEKHGVMRGVGLAVKRICRCHPWNPGGVDPVP